jgi:hypothetical protein
VFSHRFGGTKSFREASRVKQIRMWEVCGRIGHTRRHIILRLAAPTLLPLQRCIKGNYVVFKLGSDWFQCGAEQKRLRELEAQRRRLSRVLLGEENRCNRRTTACREAAADKLVIMETGTREVLPASRRGCVVGAATRKYS